MKKSQKIIEFKNVSLTFKDKPIFKNFNFSINTGDRVVVFGKSGTGKSTLLNLLLGFKQPDLGEIFFAKKKLSSETIWEIRKQIAYVDQDVTMGEGNVLQIIDEYFAFTANSQIKFTKQDLLAKLKQFDLDKNILDKNIDQLSGGERQRLAIAIALMLKRPLMILDEVTSALDPSSKKIVINQLLNNPRLTLLIITHDQEWKKQKNVRIFDFKEKKWMQ